MESENRYSRHELLSSFGKEGQQKVSKSSALIIGVGGLGSPASIYLASSGVAHITLVDQDVVDLTNLQRQIVHAVDRIGISKAFSAKMSLDSLNPEISITAISHRPSEDELKQLVMATDVVLDCTDNSESRYKLNAICRQCKKPLVTAGVVGFDGQITVLDFRREESPCYACLFPCHEGKDEKASTKGVFAPLVGVLGCLQASEALKILAGVGSNLTDNLLMVDLLSNTFTKMRYRRNPDCPECGFKKE